MGSKKQKAIVSQQLIIQPLKCGEIVTKEKDKDKWLGQILSGGGLSDSVAETVAAREGRVRGAVHGVGPGGE